MLNVVQRQRYSPPLPTGYILGTVENFSVVSKFVEPYLPAVKQDFENLSAGSGKPRRVMNSFKPVPSTKKGFLQLFGGSFNSFKNTVQFSPEERTHPTVKFTHGG